MSKMYFPFNSIVVGGVADRAANAESFAAYFKGVIRNGVLFGEDSLKAETISGMNLRVLSGTAYINGKVYTTDEAEVITIETASATLGRIDRVVLRLSEADRLMELDVLKGTPASSPVAPALTRRADTYELCLAEVTVPAGATSILASYIKDTRASPDLCGWVTSLVQPDTFIYQCNGSNDNVTLKDYINMCLTLQDKVNIKIKGQFGYDGTRYTVNGNSYIFTCIGSDNNVTLDFSGCDISAHTNFLYAQNVTIKGMTVRAVGGSHVVSGNNASFIECDISGQFNQAAAIGLSLTGGRLISSIVNIYNSSGTATGIAGSGAYITDCDVSAQSNAASAYALDMMSCMAQGCIFYGKTASADTTASGNGAIATGQFMGCSFEGVGALKGQGFFLRAGYTLQASGCIFRGYTANAASGWGIGITGAASDAITVSLFGINCNQVALTGYTQTKSCLLTQGHGSIAGLFYTAIEVPTTIVSYGSFNRNRT